MNIALMIFLWKHDQSKLGIESMKQDVLPCKKQRSKWKKDIKFILASPWQLRPIGVFSGKKYNRRLINKHCSFLSRHTILNSAKHAIGESDHGRTAMQSPNPNTIGFFLKLFSCVRKWNEEKRWKLRSQIETVNWHARSVINK